MPHGHKGRRRTSKTWHDNRKQALLEVAFKQGLLLIVSSQCEGYSVARKHSRPLAHAERLTISLSGPRTC